MKNKIIKKVIEKFRKRPKYLKPEYKVRCPECIKKFQTIMMIRINTNICDNKIVWQCSNCNNIFEDKTKKYGKIDLKKLT